ncbi:MAG: tRNA 4-thiouridine(8) synthase ThiI [Candidatus Omnitrophota bacterium]
MKKKKVKAIILFSGGLDSILAAKLILDQGVEAEGVIFTSVFYSSIDDAKNAAKELGIKLKVFEISREFFKVFKNPRYGYGSNLNPCIDCHIFMFKKAGFYMKKIGADFLVTGEVLGERPMSQNRTTMKVIEKQSGFEGLILRPLSAKYMEPTIPEKEGMVDREKFLSITGRSRKPQIELAEKFGVKKYPAPAGGCLLTDVGFSRRMRDLMEDKKSFSVNDVELLKTGRHFRLNSRAKLVVGRDEKENKRLLTLIKDGDYAFSPCQTKGPFAAGRGEFSEEAILTASGIVARYCDKETAREIKIANRRKPEKKLSFVTVLPMDNKDIDVFRI